MKYKIGDKVRIRSKEWWDAQPKNANGSVVCGDYNFTDEMTPLCGKTVQITAQFTNSYLILGCMYNFTDEMFDDSYNPEKSILSEGVIKDIAKIVKKHNLGVSISENNGKLIIEPLKVEEEEDLPIDTPVMCSLDAKNWSLGYYYKNGRVYLGGFASKNGLVHMPYDYIITFDKFNPNDIEESLKYNIVK